MAGGRNVQVIAIARTVLLEGRSRPSASRPSLRRKIASKTHSVIYQNDAEQLIYRSIFIYITIYLARRDITSLQKVRHKCVDFWVRKVGLKSGSQKITRRRYGTKRNVSDLEHFTW